MSDAATPYYLTEEFCKKHGRLNVTQLGELFARRGDTVSPQGATHRRINMAKAYPSLVARISRSGKPSGYMYDGSVDPQATEPPRADATGGEKRYPESVEMLADGGYKSDRLITMSAEQSKDPAYLLAAHGFDESWEIVTAKNAIWNVYSKDIDGGHEVSTLYSSKVTVRPRRAHLDIDAIADALRAVEPVTIERPSEGSLMLEVACHDMHFGNSTIEWYAEQLGNALAAIESRTWAQVLLPIGSDLFHCDNFKNTTSNGTAQSSVDWPSAWADALAYYSALIESALSHSAEVYAYYIIGNHDESMAWAFCQMLEARYPQVTFDTSIAERKVHTFGQCAVGMTHGDGRTRKDLDRVFMAEFPEFAAATVREVHAGHYHHEVTVDQFGVVVRSLSTAARTDKWHREEGFVGAMKRFVAFTFTPHRLKGVEYL